MSDTELPIGLLEKKEEGPDSIALEIFTRARMVRAFAFSILSFLPRPPFFGPQRMFITDQFG
jgi:hypothetical protein